MVSRVSSWSSSVNNNLQSLTLSLIDLLVSNSAADSGPNSVIPSTLDFNNTIQSN